MVFIVRFDDIHTRMRALKPPKMPNKHFIKLAYRVQTIARLWLFFSLSLSLCMVPLFHHNNNFLLFSEYMFIVFWVSLCVCACAAETESLIFHHRYKCSGEWCWRYDKDTVSHTMWLGHRNAIGNVGVMETFLWYCFEVKRPLCCCYYCC